MTITLQLRYETIVKTLSSNISALTLISILQKIYVGRTSCLYFCPHSYEKFLSGLILLQSITYEENNEICYCCSNCRNEIQLRTNFSDETLGYFSELKTLLIQYYYVVDKLS